MTLLHRVLDTLMSAEKAGGIDALMRVAEMNAGLEIVQYGDATPIRLNPMDWAREPVISFDDRFVYIVAIAARRTNDGAFTRLLRAIKHAGRTPAVVNPIGPIMIDFLDRHNWVQNICTRNGEEVDVWTPTSSDARLIAGCAR